MIRICGFWPIRVRAQFLSFLSIRERLLFFCYPIHTQNDAFIQGISYNLAIDML